MAPYAVTRPIFLSPRPRLALAALLCVAGIVQPVGTRLARAGDCAAGASPAGAAGTSALYGELASTVSAEPLSVDITARAIGGTCTWVYEVKILTPSGSVAFLDFDLVDLDLRRVDGSPSDPDIARLMDRLSGGDEGGAQPGSDESGTGEPGSDDSGGDNSGSGESGSGGDSSGSGSDGDSGGDSGGGDSGGSEGGEGGGSGGGGSGGGGSGGGGEGGEGGSDD
nr:hypothetical protein [uncultured Dongia sp.]